MFSRALSSFFLTSAREEERARWRMSRRVRALRPQSRPRRGKQSPGRAEGRGAEAARSLHELHHPGKMREIVLSQSVRIDSALKIHNVIKTKPSILWWCSLAAGVKQEPSWKRSKGGNSALTFSCYTRTGASLWGGGMATHPPQPPLPTHNFSSYFS